MDKKVDPRIASLLAIGVIVVACGASAASLLLHLSFQLSLHAGTQDGDGKPMLGTEIMHLVPHQDRLYAGNSLWMENDPQTAKACQILVLDTPNGTWKVDHQFTRRNLRLAALRSFTFTTDGSGKAIRPVPMLLAAPDVTVHGTVQIFSRDDTAGTWVPTNFAEASKYSTTRALGLHRDKTTGVDRIFAGNDQLGIFSGVYDSRAAGRIRWEQTAELDVPAGERAMGFCNCNGVFFCATTCNIFMRTDGHSPSWKKVYSRPEEIAPVGIRGKLDRGDRRQTV
jgi:poly(A) polymerase